MTRHIFKFAALGLMYAGMASAAQATEWRGYAINDAPNPRFIMTRDTYQSEYGAQMAAKTLCENHSGRACPLGDNVIAIPAFWTAAAVLCEGDGFVGGSQVGQALFRALAKAEASGYSPDRCDVVR